jgi:hypothetical protein
VRAKSSRGESPHRPKHRNGWPSASHANPMNRCSIRFRILSDCGARVSNAAQSGGCRTRLENHCPGRQVAATLRRLPRPDTLLQGSSATRTGTS